jgi:NitT/TauT family transport system substrate-binding protein
MLRLVATLGVSAVLATACGGGGSEPSSDAGASQSKELDIVELSMYAIPGGLIGWIPYGMEKGIYAKHGIQVNLHWSKGSGGATTEVSGGQTDFAISSADSVAQATNTGSKLKMVMGVTQRRNDGVFVKKDSGITSPAQLKGRSIAVANGSVSAMLLPEFLAHYGLNTDDVKTVSVAQSALISVYLAGQVDGFVSGIPAYEPQLNLTGNPVRSFAYTDAGLGGISHGLLTKDETVQNNPDLVKRMIAATSESMEAAYANPDEAAKACAKLSPEAGLDEAVTAAQIKATEEYDNTDNTKGHPRGWMSDEDWAETVKVAQTYEGVKPDIKLSDLYTNDLLPKN